jgi:GcrA cell cycle regulator
MRGVRWGEELLDTARKMWAEGATCAEIGAAIGKPKNAVTGMAHSRRAEFPTRIAPGDLRQKNSGNRTPRIKAPKSPKAPKPEAKQKQVWAVRSDDIARAKARAAQEAEETRARLADDSADAAGEGVIAPLFRRVPLLALTERSCKWPMGDPVKADFCFCGNDAPDVAPYCTFHQRLAYQPRAARVA